MSRFKVDKMCGLGLLLLISVIVHPGSALQCDNSTTRALCMCTNGDMVAAHALYDGRAHCSDNSDEVLFSCGTPGEFHCPSGTCIDAAWVLDGGGDCPGDVRTAADEAKHVGSLCNMTKTCCLCEDYIPHAFCNSNSSRCECQPGHISNRIGTACYPACGRVTSVFSCSTGQSVNCARMRNGVNDCSDNSDEVLGPSPCFPGEFRCSSGSQCLPSLDQVLDGTPQCSDSSDEVKVIGSSCNSTALCCPCDLYVNHSFCDAGLSSPACACGQGYGTNELGTQCLPLATLQSNLALVVGLSSGLGVVLLIAAVVILAYFLHSRAKGKQESAYQAASQEEERRS